jgi:hypothetical protein
MQTDAGFAVERGSTRGTPALSEPRDDRLSRDRQIVQIGIPGRKSRFHFSWIDIFDGEESRVDGAGILELSIPADKVLAVMLVEEKRAHGKAFGEPVTENLELQSTNLRNERRTEQPPQALDQIGAERNEMLSYG